MASETKQNFGPALGVLSSLFFMWGLITSLNSVLVPYLKNVFQLNDIMSNLVNSAFFIAFLIISVPAGKLVSKTGYKKGCVIGLIVCALSAGLFVLCGTMQSFPLFMVATFAIAIGVTILQVAANPFVTVLGSPEGASGRLNMTQGLNSFGTYIAPLIGGAFILKGVESLQPADKVKMVQTPYIVLAIILVVLAVVIAMFKLPDPMKENTSGSDTAKAEETAFEKLHSSAWAYRHVLLGVLGIFAYVGAEVAVGSNIIGYLSSSLSKNVAEVAPFAALYWGAAMVGRFFAALMFSKGGSKKIGWAAVVAIIAFAIAWFALKDPKMAAIYFGIAVANYIFFQIGAGNDKRTLGIFSIIAAILAFTPMLVSGSVSMWTLCAIGLFNSMMFPTIFSLGIAKLGKKTPQASAALCVGIVGGGVIPPIWGLVSTKVGPAAAFSVCAVCYAYIAFYAFIGSKPEEVVAPAPVPVKA